MIFYNNLLKVEINTVKLIKGEDSLIFTTDRWTITQKKFESQNKMKTQNALLINFS
jgi:hypothetical protein